MLSTGPQGPGLVRKEFARCSTGKGKLQTLNFLGPFPLWSEKLTPRQVATFGTLSSVISLYKALKL